ncbi:L-serine dehydratase 1 [Vibrio aerogenes CECT 7868]|uniref:L-serine dehydratase n=1 Tax=Vibrio aerogenes CECT 7868 TaxID=1216006 RepID=A0A1M5XR56_9VIBR|nr:L-serine ammonia-lyase [Vibrio aerogenes]SHI02028.1 L-serine dehydratase 1 [Vibrio aerogenes CECT 7868]
MISVFDIFKIGIGPSSSHTMGPMKASHLFIETLHQKSLLKQVTQITVDVYGSLSLTGKGHQTDVAIILGLSGYTPENVDIDQIPDIIREAEQNEFLQISTHQNHRITFPRDSGMTFHTSYLPAHENAMTIHAWHGKEELLSETYYSVGGGFVVDEKHLGQPTESAHNVPFPYTSASELVDFCRDAGLSISTLVMENESACRPRQEVTDYLLKIWQTMKDCMERGMKTEGILPGPLRVPRRSAALHQQLLTSEKHSNDPMAVIDWVNMYAFAINEENAAGGRVVTAPTNGACGLIPAVFAYYNKFIQPVTEQDCIRYLSTCCAIGGLYKRNASISGAEVGCQGEIGVACSMAAAGLAELFGASPEQVCMAAEIAMEHNLGLTCDPVAGQVQVPCIERNGIAAVKAINATRMALRRASEPRVSLDKVIETMLETGKDMNAKYRETSQGGLAVKVIC